MFHNTPNIFVLPEVLSDDIIEEVKEIGSKYINEEALTTGDVQGQREATRSFIERGFEPPDWSDRDKVMNDLEALALEDPDDGMWRDMMIESISALGNYRRCEKIQIPLRFEPWMASMINHHCHEANMEWGFDITWPKQAELLEYSDVGDHYDWHVDTSMVPSLATDGDTHPNVLRKITMIWQLSDADEYEGGDLELTATFDQWNILDASKELLRKKGTVIAFPSFMMHRITPIVSGRRQSMVSWMHGPAWR